MNEKEDNLWKRTFCVDLLRAFPMGFLETVFSTFAMFLAIRVYDVSVIAKSCIIAAPSLGLLGSLFTVAIVRRGGWSVTKTSAVLWVVSGSGFVLASLAKDSALYYVVGLVVAGVFHQLVVPLSGQIYRKHYPASIRGKLFSYMVFLRAGAAGVFAYFASGWLKSGLEIHWLFGIFSLCSFFQAIVTLLIKPVYLRKQNQLSLFDAFGHLKTDRRFAKLITSWMVLGMGNLLCMALFVEYITSIDYGLVMSVEEVSLLTSTVPSIAFILSIIAWGIIYDSMEFYRLRILINLFFIVGVVVYFQSDSFMWLCCGMVFHAVGKAGGNVIWTLWTTKFAPVDKVSEYMSVHTCMTGVRGVFSAFLAFPVAAALGPGSIGLLGGGLMLVASLMLAPELKEHWGQKNRNA